jgi:hypothetical protein
VSAAVPFSKKENKALPKLVAASQRKFLAISNRMHHCTEGQLNYDAQRICPQNWVSVSL